MKRPREDTTLLLPLLKAREYESQQQSQVRWIGSVMTRTEHPRDTKLPGWHLPLHRHTVRGRGSRMEVSALEMEFSGRTYWMLSPLQLRV